MWTGLSRRRVAAAVIVAVALITVPSFANDQGTVKGERGFFAWLTEQWTTLVSVTLAGGMHADPNGGDQPPSGSGAGNSASAQPAPADAGRPNDQ